MLKDLLPSQARAGRALINWSQEKLSEASGLGISTVRDFESGRRDPTKQNVEAIWGALSKEGVKFIAEGEAGGPGVRLERENPKIIRHPSGVSFETDSLPFTVRWRGKDVYVYLATEILDDLDRANQRNDREYVASFKKWEKEILRSTAQAIYAGRVDSQARLRLRTNDFPELR